MYPLVPCASQSQQPCSFNRSFKPPTVKGKGCWILCAGVWSGSIFLSTFGLAFQNYYPENGPYCEPLLWHSLTLDNNAGPGWCWIWADTSVPYPPISHVNIIPGVPEPSRNVSRGVIRNLYCVIGFSLKNRSRLPFSPRPSLSAAISISINPRHPVRRNGFEGPHQCTI
jgi:hypothetical protein